MIEPKKTQPTATPWWERQDSPDDAASSSSAIRASLSGRLTCSVDEAAKLLGIGRSTAYAAARDGSLPVLRLSRRVLVSVPRLLAMIEGPPAGKAE
jgi:excisionase family DNA binding protein